MADSEKIIDGGILEDLRRLSSKIAKGGELDNQIKIIDELSDNLSHAWNSQESIQSKNAIHNVNNELSNLRIEVDNLIEELSRYHIAAENINSNTL